MGSMESETHDPIDVEVKKIVDVSYELCKTTLARHRPLMDTLVERLLDVETIKGSELLQMLKEYDAKLYEQLGKTPPPENEPQLTPAM